MKKIISIVFLIGFALTANAYLTPIGGGGGGGVSAVIGTSPIISSGGTTPAISCQFASGSQAGCISAANFTTFSSSLSNPMTTLGDTLYENATPAPARIPGNITTNREFFSQTGTGTVSAAPSWGLLLSGDIPNNAANTTGTASNITATSNSTLTTLSALSLPTSQLSGNVSLTSQVSGILPIANGGSGAASTSQNFAFIGPTSGSGAPSFRAIVAGDIPTLNQNTTGTAANITATTNSTLTTLPSLSLPYSQVTGTPAALTFTAPLSLTGSTVSISQATTSTNGYLSSTDWNTFNGKQAAGNYITALTGDVVAAGPGSAASTIQPNVVSNSKLAQMAANSIKGNNTGSAANAIDLTATQTTAMLNPVVGDSGSGGTQGLVPAPAALSAASGDFLSASGSFSYVDQSNTVNPAFQFLTQGAAPSGAIKFETTQIFTSITTGKKYAVGVGFIDTPTLAIWDISDQSNPILAGTYSHSAGGAYNATFGVVSGVQYAFIGYNSGAKIDIVNMTNPTNPVDVGTFTITGTPGSIYGVSFLNGYVYCATQSTGLVVVDVGGGTGSPSAPVQTYQQGSSVKSFGVVAIGSNVYTTSYSTSSPYTTRQIISWTLSGAGTPAIPSVLQSLQVTAAGEALGLSVNGNTAFVTTAATGAYNINLVDITNPSSMSNLSQINSSNTFGSGFYATGSGNYVYVPSGGNVTYGGAIDVYDITTRTSPVHIAQSQLGIASNLFGTVAISGGYLFVADYGNAAGTTGALDVFRDMFQTNVVGAETVSQLTVVDGITGNLTGTASLATNLSGGLGGQIPYQSAANTTAFLANGTSGQVLQSNGTTAAPSWVTPSSGAITSVGFADTSTTPIYTITNSPLTSSGTIDQTLNTQSANFVFAGPTTGSAAQPSFRGLVSADIPNNAANTSGTASNITATSNSTLTTLSALSLPGSQVTGNISGNSANVTGTVAIANGGTGQITAPLAFAALSPLTTSGDVIYENATPAPARLGIGTSGQVLTVSGGLPSWQTPVPGFTNPMTTLGDLIYENATPAAARLAGSTSATKQFLTQTGTGSVSAAPAWGALASGDIPNNAANTSGTASNITATSNSTLTTLSALSLPYSQVTGAPAAITALTGDVTASGPGSSAASLVATTNGTLTTLSALSLPLSQTTGVLPIAKGGTNNGFLSVAAGGIVASDGSKLVNVGAGTSGQFLKSNGASAPTWSSGSFSPTAPTFQIFTSGSGTYTPPTSPAPLYIKVTMIGGGGGGGGSTSSGGNGGNTTFRDWTCGGGIGAASSGLVAPTNGGAGGAPTAGTGTVLVSVAGGYGNNAGTGGLEAGANGASTPFGGAGNGGPSAGNGTAGIANTGAGGGGNGYLSGTAYNSGGGGGGAYQQFVINSPSSYSYSIGAGGTAGASNGAMGGSGFIEVEEFYQ